LSVLYVVIPLALLIAAGWVAAFAWAVRGGQMDDLDTPQARMLHDDEEPGAAGKGPKGGSGES
jgi:cbb3-type cytochrome oxidase maturation protein